MSSGQDTRIATAGRLGALLAIFGDLLNLAASMLPEFAGKNKISMSSRRAIVEAHLVQQPGSPGVPFVAHVAFAGERQRVGFTVAQREDGDGKPVYHLVPLYDMAITGKAEIPVKDEPHKREARDVIALVTCDGRGGLVPYVVIDEVDGSIRGGEPMLCMFVYDFDQKTGQENARIRAIPLGLAKADSLARWNEIVTRMAAQDPTKAWEAIDPIGNGLGRAVQYLELQPTGAVAHQGLLPVYKPARDKEVDPQKPDYWIVARLGGKAATKDRDSRDIIVKGDMIPNHYFRFRETWSSIQLKVWGLVGEIKTVTMRELSMGEARVDALALFGTTLYHVTPGSGPALMGRALTTLPRDYMVAEGWVTPDVNDEALRGVLRGMGSFLRNTLREQVESARKQIIHALGTAGKESNGRPSLAEILGGEKSPEALHKAMFQSEGLCPLASWMLTSTTTQNLGLVTWDWNCWVLREARKDLLMELARSQGLELPKPPSETPQGGEGGGGGESAAEPDPIPEASVEGDGTSSKLKVPKRERKPRSGKKAKAEGEGAEAS